MIFIKNWTENVSLILGRKKKNSYIGWKKTNAANTNVNILNVLQV